MRSEFSQKSKRARHILNQHNMHAQNLFKPQQPSAMTNQFAILIGESIRAFLQGFNCKRQKDIEQMQTRQEKYKFLENAENVPQATKKREANVNRTEIS